MHPDAKAAMLAGPLVGLAGGSLFALAHALLIKPVAFLLVVGAVFALVAGPLAGWAWLEARRAGRARPGVHLGLLCAGSLVPAAALSLARPVMDGVEPPFDAWRAAVLVLPVLGGFLLGYSLTRLARGSAAFALLGAGVAFAFSQQVALTPLAGAPGLFLAVVALVFLGSGLALDRLQPLLAGRPDRAGA